MTIIITGAGGQVGRELVARARPGQAVVGLDRHQLDISNQDAVAEALARHRASLLINAAAYTAVDKAESEAALAYAVNRDAVEALAQACRLAAIPCLHLSTDYVFDGAKSDAYSEDDPPNPGSVYGKSKLAGESALRAVLPAHLILRVSWVFGAHGSNFVRTMLRLAGERPILRVVADQLGGPTPAASIADALLDLAERYDQGDSLPWGTYHYAGAPVISWHGFALEILEQARGLGMLDRLPEVIAINSAEYPTPARRPANSVLDMSRSSAVLGLSAPDWRVALSDVLNAWKNS